MGDSSPRQRGIVQLQLAVPPAGPTRAIWKFTTRF